MAMTQIEAARKGIITPAMESVLKEERISPQTLMERLAKGEIVILANRVHLEKNLQRPLGVGKGLKTKVNANIGTSYDYPDLEEERKKLKALLKAGADSMMDLSTGGMIAEIRRALMEECPIPMGTVPIYEAEYRAVKEKGSFLDMEFEDYLEVFEEQAREGVDFFTIHAGLRLDSLRRLKEVGRLTKIVSRGGGLIAAWMLKRGEENPLYTHFDELLEICHEYDVTVSLGDGLRPGSLRDATDAVQIDELLTLGELVERCRKANVQVMVEGPGHIPLHEIPANILLQKKVCKGAPFYVLGPLVTDVGAGWDHITGAIGGAIAAAHGADLLCYITPAEHLGLPTPEHVYEGVIAFRIAAHAGDISKGIEGAIEWDDAMSKARYELNWEEQLRLALDPYRAREIFEQRASATRACSMCGPFCPMNLVEKFLVRDLKVLEQAL
jgi:phosphomethylpyrimidine synthase